MARIIVEAVSNAVANHLNDPRIDGFISVTRVQVSPDLRKADVYLSIMAKSPSAQQKTFAALLHARSRIQYLVAEAVRSKFCPTLCLYQDENLKKTLETMRIIADVNPGSAQPAPDNGTNEDR
jgi:ribosome-binding factor A